MTDILTRDAKGYPLSHREVDRNFTNLNAAVVDASGAAISAGDSAVAAAASASTAAGSAVAAAASAVLAADYATDSQDAAGESTASAAAALGSLNTFRGAWYGSLAADPTVDPLGNPMNVGDAYFNTTVPGTKTYDGAAWSYIDNRTQLASAVGATLIGSGSTTVQQKLDILAFGVADPMTLGAVGDGIADDTVAVLLAKNTGGLLDLSRAPVAYRITGTIALLANQQVQGAGKHIGGIRANMAAPIFTFGDSVDPTLRYFHIRNLYAINAGGSVIKSRYSAEWSTINCDLQCTSNNKVVSGFVKKDAGGTGYTVGDVLTIVGGTGVTTAAQFTATTVVAGVVTAVTLLTAGVYTTLPYCVLPAGVSVTGGTGTGCELEVFDDATIDCQQTYRCSFYGSRIMRSGVGFCFSFLDNTNAMEINGGSYSGGSVGGVADIGRSYNIKFRSGITEVSKFGIRVGTNPSAALSGECNAIGIDNYNFEQCCEPLRIGDWFACNGVTVSTLYITNSVTTSIAYRDASVVIGRVSGLSIQGCVFTPHSTEYIFDFHHSKDLAAITETVHSGEISNNKFSSNGMGYKLSGAYVATPSLASKIPRGLYMEFGVASNLLDPEYIGERRYYDTGKILPSALTNISHITKTGTLGAYIERVELIRIDPSADLNGVLNIGDTAGIVTNMSSPLIPRVITGAANNGAGLIRITSNGHGYLNGQRPTVSGVTGTTEANGTWVVSGVTANTYDLVGSTFANAYVSGGVASLFTWTQNAFGYYADITAVLSSKFVRVSDQLLTRIASPVGTGTVQVKVTYHQ